MSRRARRENGEDDSLSSIAREAEARLAAKRAARAEAREIRLKELEKQQREEANGLMPPQIRPTRDDYSSTNGSSGRMKVEVTPDQKMRRLENTYFNELKELRDSTSQLEEKYKKAMVQNAQLDNEKTTIHYENEHMRDLLEEVEDQLSNSLKELNQKSQEAQRFKTMLEASNVKLEQMREIIREKDQIIQDKSNSDHLEQIREMKSTLIWRDNKIKALEAQRDYFQKQAQAQVALVVAERRSSLVQDGGLLPGEEDQLETQKLLDEIDKLRNELILEQQKKSSLNNEDVQVKEKLYQETKSRANKAEQEVEAQKATIARLEGQVSRYKAAADHYESSEDNLKADKRRLQRELRQCEEKLEEVELTNEHLEKRLEKIRAARQKS